MTYLLIGILFIVALSIYLRSGKSKSSANSFNPTKPEAQDTPVEKKAEPQNNPYLDLRNLAFSATAEQTGLTIPDDQTKIYGVIMDWDLGDATATLVAFLSGDASLYLSSGGGIIGGRGHENVKKAASVFIGEAEKYLSRSNKTDSTPLPGKDGVKFYFLTNKGKFVGEEQMRNFANNSSPWLDLFKQGNDLISAMRVTADMKKAASHNSNSTRLKIEKRPYDLFAIVSVVLFILSFFMFQSTFDIHLHDTFVVLTLSSVCWIFCIILLLLWGVYQIIYPRLFSARMTWIHVLLTILILLGTVIFSWWAVDIYNPRQRRTLDYAAWQTYQPIRNTNNIMAFVLLIFILGQLVFLINIILGLLKKSIEYHPSEF